MYIPSLTTILGTVFLIYIAHSMWIMAQLFSKLECTDTPCYRSFLAARPTMQLAIFTSTTTNPISSEVTKIYSSKNFDYWHAYHQEFEIDVPLKTRRNGSLYMQVVFAMEGEPLEWRTLRRDGPTIIHAFSLTEHIVPRLAAYNLLSENTETQPLKSGTGKAATTINVKPVTHIMSQVYVALLTDSISLSQKDVPPEMARLIHVNRNHEILPILKTDIFNTRLKDLVQVTRNTTEFKIDFHCKPIGIGKLRLMLMIEHALKTIQTMGFSKKDVDEVKGMFSDTNVYLLCGTVLVASVHLLFDFLSFKNDVLFWRKKQSYAGLSTRTTLWRAFSQVVIFLYLVDEHTSMLVVVPAGLGLLIEVWKCKKILKVDIGLHGIRRRGNQHATTVTGAPNNGVGAAEQRTEEFDRLGMKYLSYVLYPLCLAGAIYSLLYQPHRSWYSWTLNSLVNGVYAFGFLFMLPQLFVNYKLKSVAALPWRAFMYKAFNTFIDDFFAFIISMPTAHRVACLRDDVVFLIYLYQRWLYPVDKNRLDTGLTIEESYETNGNLTPTTNDHQDDANDKKHK